MESKMQNNIILMMKSQLASLESDLTVAKFDFANSSLDDGDWQCKYERRMTCKMIEAQIMILNKMINEISMFSDMKMPSLVSA
jgi:hypothetical protein